MQTERKARVGVAIGYKDNDVWSTEGWWNVAANSCETLMRGPLVARFIISTPSITTRAANGRARPICVREKKNSPSRGRNDCLARGYDRIGFFEVDTSEQKNWTVQLTEQGLSMPPSDQRPYAPQPGKQPQ